MTFTTLTRVGQGNGSSDLRYDFTGASLQKTDIQVTVIESSTSWDSFSAYSTNAERSYNGNLYKATGSISAGQNPPIHTTGTVNNWLFLRATSIGKNINTHYTIPTYSTTTGGTVEFIAGSDNGLTSRGFATGSTVNNFTVRIERVTSSNPIVEFAAGSSVKAADLNKQNKQALFVGEDTREAVNSLAVGDPQSAFQVSGSNIISNSITTGKIDNGAIVNEDINVSAAIDGTKISPNFGSQDITTTGSLDIPYRIQTTSNPSGTIFGGTDFGFGVVPSGTPSNKSVFIAIGDGDTGIVQDTDGQLELWSNAEEVANFNNVDGITTSKKITASDINVANEIYMGGDINTANSHKYLDVQTGTTESFFIRGTEANEVHSSPTRDMLRLTHNGTTGGGTAYADNFIGGGAGLTNLNPANIANGTLPAGVTGAAFTNKPAWYMLNPKQANGTSEISISPNTWTLVGGYLTDESGTHAESGTNTSNGDFTIPANRAGFYVIFGGVSVVNLDQGDVIQIQFYKNGVAIGPEHRDFSGIANQTLTTSLIRLGNFAAGDVIQVAVRHNEPGSRNLDGAKCFFGGFRLLT